MAVTVGPLLDKNLFLKRKFFNMFFVNLKKTFTRNG